MNARDPKNKTQSPWPAQIAAPSAAVKRRSPTARRVTAAGSAGAMPKRRTPFTL